MGMDAYAGVKEGLQGSDTLLKEAQQTYTRFVGHARGKLVALTDIFSAMQHTQDKMPVIDDLVHQMASDEARERKRRADLKAEEQAADPEAAARAEVKKAKEEIKGAGHLHKVHLDDEWKDDEGHVRMITVLYLKDNVLKMRGKQATELIEEAIMHFYKEHKEESDFERVANMVRECDFETRKIFKRLRRVVTAAGGDDPGSSSEEDNDQDESLEAQREEERTQKEEFQILLEECQDDLLRADLHVGLEAPVHKAHDHILTKWPRPWAPSDEKEEEEEGSESADDEEALRAAQDEGVELQQGCEVLEKRIEELREDVEDHLHLASKLSDELLRKDEERADVGARLHRLQRQVVALAADRRKEMERMQREEEELQEALRTREGCFNLTQRLFGENRELRERVKNAKKRSYNVFEKAAVEEELQKDMTAEVKAKLTWSKGRTVGARERMQRGVQKLLETVDRLAEAAELEMDVDKRLEEDNETKDMEELCLQQVMEFVDGGVQRMLRYMDESPELKDVPAHPRTGK